MGTVTAIEQHITVPILVTGKPSDVKKYTKEIQPLKSEFSFRYASV
jgi:hypothetical protein